VSVIDLHMELLSREFGGRSVKVAVNSAVLYEGLDVIVVTST
jgi:hypothetical protein